MPASPPTLPFLSTVTDPVAAPGDPPGTGQPGPADFYAAAFRESLARIRTEVIWVTPEWARLILAKHNLRNRHVTQGSVDKVATAILNGDWEFNGEPIIFHDDGVLADGQHRLLGIVQAGMAVPVLAVYGTRPESFDSLGGNKPRTKGDIISIPRAGRPPERDANALAAALGWLYRWQQGRMTDSGCVLPNTKIFDLIDENPGIRDSLKAVRERSRKNVVACAVASFLHYAFGKVDPAARDAFFAQLLDGVGIAADSHMALLQRWLKNRADAVKTRLFTVEVAAVVIKTWNRIRTGSPVKGTLVWRTDEGFPNIDGIEPMPVAE